MTSGRAAWLRKVIADWAPRAAARRRSGTAPDLLIAGVLERIVAEYQAELAAAAPALEQAAAIAAECVTWSSVVFNAGGRFDPFAGTRAQQMLASADACDRLGQPAAAAMYREIAAAGGSPDTLHDVPVASAPTRPRRRSAPCWSGPNITPPEPAAFVAGPQLGLFA